MALIMMIIVCNGSNNDDIVCNGSNNDGSNNDDYSL